MDEDDILKCRLEENVWKCPVEQCHKLLCRKQTLKNHIASQHDIQAGRPSKRYKLYENDDTVSVPKTTLWRRKEVRQPKRENPPQEGIQKNNFDCVVPTLNDVEDSEDLAGSCTELSDQDDSDHANSSIDVTSSDDEEETSKIPVAPKSRTDDPPLYVIPPSSGLYSSTVTRSEYLLAASALANRHNLSAVAIKDVLRFSQLGLPKNNIAHTTIDQLKESCGFDENYLKYHIYCESCTKLFDTDPEQQNCRTPGCQGKKKANQCYFVTGKLDVQLTEILERQGIWSSIELSRNMVTTGSISDINSGLGYKKLKEQGGFLDKTSNITLSLFIDGIPLFTSSAVSLWPVYLLINEIPPKERFRKKNMLLWGVWQGTGKPKMNMFLRPLVMDLLNIYTNGVTFQTCSQNQEYNEITTKAMLVVATMDLQARAYVCSMTQHNGLHGCLYCMEPGEVVPSGKAHCRAYLKRDEPPLIRTDEAARASAVVARESNSRTEGFLGESVLWYLPYFSMTTNVVIDYMHGILLGVTKRMLDFWFNSKFSAQPYFIGSKMADIDKILKKIKPPYFIHRLPRILTNNYHHWKASELRNWLLFYSLPCLTGQLPEVYETHFSCLVEATYLLLTEGISASDLTRADALLQVFVSNVQRLYGKECMSLNVHNLTHLVPFVKLWGPLWAWSCFPYESFNGEIKRSIHGTGNVCKQIFWSLQAQKRIESSLKSRELESSNEVNCFLRDMLDTRTERFSADSEAFQCSIIKCSTSLLVLNSEILNSLKSLVGTDKKEDFIGVTKIARNGFQMYCKSCCKMKKQNSYTIKLENFLKTNDGRNADAVEIESYVLERKTRKVFAIGKLIMSSGSILPGRASFLQKLEFVGNELTVVPAETLREPMMIVPVKTNLFGAILPNSVERD